MALESLAGFDESLERRRFLASLYRSYLDDVPGIEFQTFSERDTSTFKDLTIRVDADVFGVSRDGLALALLAEGIDTRKYFDPPVHRQRAYGHLEYRRLPVTDAVATSVLSLPVYPDLTDEQVERVCEVIRSCTSTRSSSTRTCRRWPRSTPASSSSTSLLLGSTSPSTRSPASGSAPGPQ